jgi:hypothetical protein
MADAFAPVMDRSALELILTPLEREGLIVLRLIDD